MTVCSFRVLALMSVGKEESLQLIFVLLFGLGFAADIQGKFIVKLSSLLHDYLNFVPYPIPSFVDFKSTEINWEMKTSFIGSTTITLET